MGSHLIDGEFQSDKYPTCPPGKVPLSTKDPMAQDLLWEYAQRRHAVDAQFANDLEAALLAKGYTPRGHYETLVALIEAAPLTFLPALLIVCVKACVKRGVFNPGGIQRTVESAIAKAAG